MFSLTIFDLAKLGAVPETGAANTAHNQNAKMMLFSATYFYP